MKRIVFFALFLLSTSTLAQNQNSSLVDIDFRKHISRADLVYDKPVDRSEEGQPIGNGRMGSLVWTTPSLLKFQINRVDVFGNNSASNNFYERHTDYCGGVGLVDVDFGEQVFTGEKFKQQLSCYDAVSTVEGNDVGAQVLVWNEEDVMAVKVTDRRKGTSSCVVNLKTLRLPVTKKGNHSAISKVFSVDGKIVLTQEFKEDNYYCGSAVVIDVAGREAHAEVSDESSVRLLTSGNPEYTVFISSAASFDPKEDLVAVVMKKLEAAKKAGFEAIFKSNKEWWHQFWEKSFVHLSSQDGEADFVEKNYTYYLYVMASCSRGDYPTKFNGMLWTTGGDSRKWGALYWGANQSCLYNALFYANHLELLDPLFNMYTRGKESFVTAAVQQWGSRGIFIPEVVGFDGIPELPEDIAAEMRDLYLMKKPWEKRSKRFDDYSLNKMPFLTRWNWKKDEGWKEGRWYSSDKGGGSYGHVTHIFSRGAKIAYLYWLKYEFTKDEKWLKDFAYPILKGVGEFYRNFPNVRKENDGKYHIYNVNDNESIWGGHNTVEEISSMMGVFPVLIKASEILKTDAEMRPVWKEFLNYLSPLPLSPNVSGKVTWVGSLPPVVHGNAERLPDPNTMPAWFFDLCNPDSESGLRDIANNTFDAYFPKGIDKSSDVYVLSRLPVAGAILGREESVKYLVPNQLKTAETEVLANRMDLREGSQTTSVQRLGRAAEALQYALCLSAPPAPGKEPVVHVFNAWPKDWDAQFTLAGRGGFLITSSMNKGQIEFVGVYSKAGEAIKIKNPWPDRETSVFINNKVFKTFKKEEMIEYKTKKEEQYVIVPKGVVPQKFKTRASEQIN